MDDMLLVGGSIYLRTLEEGDAAALAGLIKSNKTFWGETEPDWETGFSRVTNQLQNIQYFRDGFSRDEFYTFGIFERRSNSLIGVINLYDVKRGPFQSASAGIAIDKNNNSKGVGTDSLKLLLSFAFNSINLNRVSAEVMPRNAASVRVLEKAGFQSEGLKRENILVNGRWESHLQYALLKKEWA
ncbi:N-acetyltransferase [Bacillus salacetis]|uniref:N-acetyltransferase n=1 Tax=Bacillus salacetis TaxID=2315464 RepID=A0A3A1R117_9BACI|nr:GNAT family protein [Bacillus salacetis]RIW33313.1 N-acetyltransferase [Bacillus salacetis]